MKILIIVGSAPNVVSDVMSLIDMMRPGAGLPSEPVDFMAIGLDAVDKIPVPLTYMATNHIHEIPAIRERRRAFGGNLDYLTISSDHGTRGPLSEEYIAQFHVDIIEPYRPPSGSSAITGTFAAIRMGYEKIILCGCPLTGNAPEGNSYEVFRSGWTVNREAFGDKVRSMSGWTRELFGPPTPEWLAGKDDS